MFKFIKKTLIVSGLLLAAGFLVFGTGLSSYMRTGYKQVKKKINRSIPVEFEIHRVEDLIEQIEPEMKQVGQLIAEEQISVLELKDEINRLQANRAEKTQDVKIIRASLDGSSPQVRIGGRTYARPFVESDLGRRLACLKAAHGLIDTKNRLLASRERALEAARTKLVSINTERTHLQTLVEQLRAEMREQEALQASTLDIQIDESKLKQAQDLVKRVSRRLAVNRKMLEGQGIVVQVPQRVELEKPTRDVRAEVDEFFARKDIPTLPSVDTAVSRN